jgi:hypothetical protein
MRELLRATPHEVPEEFTTGFERWVRLAMEGILDLLRKHQALSFPELVDLLAGRHSETLVAI